MQTYKKSSVAVNIFVLFANFMLFLHAHDLKMFSNVNTQIFFECSQQAIYSDLGLYKGLLPRKNDKNLQNEKPPEKGAQVYESKFIPVQPKPSLLF